MTRAGKEGRASTRPRLRLLAAAVALLALHPSWGCAWRGGGGASPGTGAGTLPPGYEEYLGERRRTAGFTGEGRAVYRSPAGRGRVSFHFLYLRPDRLRLQFDSPFGPAVAVLDLAGGRYLFADFREGIYCEGEAGPEALGRLLGLPLDPQGLAALLFAEPDPARGGVERLRFDQRAGVLRGCRMLLAGAAGRETRVTVRYRWDPSAEGRTPLFPRELEVRGRGLGEGLSVRFLDVAPAAAGIASWEKAPIGGLRLLAEEELQERGLAWFLASAGEGGE